MTNFLRFKGKKIFNLSTLLGIALGTAWMTKLRFGFIGLSEIFFLLFIISYFFQEKINFLKKKNFYYYFFVFYIFFLIFIISPINSFIIQAPGNEKIYLLAYFVSFLIFFLTLDLLQKDKLNIRLILSIFVLIFLVSMTLNYIYFVIFRYEEFFFNYRYSGLGNNPNQPIFFLLSLLVILSIYLKKELLTLTTPIILIGFFFNSQAFFFAAIICFASFILIKFLKFVFYKKNTLLKNFSLIFIILIIFLVFFNLSYIIEIIHQSFDGVRTRLSLIKNGIEIILSYPIFGLGPGAFSGEWGAFQGQEIHNTFLDIAVRFGIFFSILILIIKILSLYIMIKNNNLVGFCYLISFIVFESFHYVGRHFVFYVLLAFLTHYCIQNFKFKKFSAYE